MTDNSDSDGSGDDDYQYNTSASELWDTFWLVETQKTQSRQRSQCTGDQQAQVSDTFCLEHYIATRVEDPEDDTVTVTQASQDATSTPQPLLRPLTAHGESRAARSTASYSVYPRPTPLPTRITLPPRSSSLVAQPSIQPLKGSKSITNIKSQASIPIVQVTPAPPDDKDTSQRQPRPAPLSSMSPPPKLRQSTSAYNIRDSAHCNTTAPLEPVPAIPDQLRSAPPQMERFVSVFEFDSDTDSGDNDTFAKRIARGLQHKKSLKELGIKKGDGSHKGHKKSASEKSALSPKKSEAALDGSGSLSRKRGGSLGRMLGFKKQ